jgi:hypothetical protein
MPIAYTLTSEVRIKLKEPIGILIRGSFAETMNLFKDLVRKERPPKIVAVGDTVSRNLVRTGIFPQLLIVDHLAMRKSVQPISVESERTVRVRNPQGTITDEAIDSIIESLKGSQHVKIIVEGEEDLLALIAILYSPENSLVVYGQPYEGIVVAKVTPEKKAEIAEILKGMETARKAK